ncbi:MAG: hypothetical protein NPIRA02_10360 [Nitrospirales bacterium]|nr:MAG: hypothetical protein NPIRA02_10360 [Nitrospirales bacterium]
MNPSSRDTPSWTQVRSYLLEHVPGWSPTQPEEPLTLQLDDDDWLLEVTPDGVLSVQAGYLLEDMQSILSDGTAEDLGSDELAKQAKFYLQQMVSKHRKRLTSEGFTERTEMNDEFVAMMFERPLDFTDLPAITASIQLHRSKFQ